MSPSRARRTKLDSSSGPLAGAGLDESLGGGELSAALPGAGSVIISKVASGTNSQGIGLTSEIFRKADQTGKLRCFRQDLQRFARLRKILIYDLDRFGQGFVLDQQLPYWRKPARFPFLDKFFQAGPFICARPLPGQQ